MNDILPVQGREKKFKDQVLVPCSKIVMLYNGSQGGVDRTDQRKAAYRLDRKSSVRFYLRIFFDLMDIAFFKSFIT